MHVQFSCVIIWIQYELVVMLLFPPPLFLDFGFKITIARITGGSLMLLFTWNTCLDIVQQQTILFGGGGGRVYGPVKFSILLAFAARTCVSARLKAFPVTLDGAHAQTQHASVVC